MDLVALAFGSMRQWLVMAGRHQLRLSKQHKGKLYQIERHGSYLVFRDSLSLHPNPDQPVVLVVGFRLKLIGSNPLLHWLFQRLCILTTPFWSGFSGFHIKLWMVDPASKNYLGIYDWYGHTNALHYVTALRRVLLRVSTKGSVWHELVTKEPFEDYLLKRQLSAASASPARQ